MTMKDQNKGKSKIKKQMTRIAGLMLLTGVIVFTVSCQAPAPKAAEVPPAQVQPQSIVQTEPDAASGQVAKIEGDVQTVKIDLSGGFQPIVVQKGIPVKFIINAEASSINECNEVVVIPEFKLQKGLAPGENIIEFTPQNEGDITYTCGMNMIRSSITVVSDLSKISGANAEDSSDSADTAPAASTALPSC